MGCGTGTLVDCGVAEFASKFVMAIDRSEGFIVAARYRISDGRVRFDVGDATALPWPSRSCDATVSGLVLNFVSNADSMAREMARARFSFGGANLEKSRM